MRQGGSKVAVISHGLWQRRFGGAANVVGQSIRLDGVPYSIVGIAPSTLDFPFDSDVWVPLALSEKDRAESRQPLPDDAGAASS